MSITCIAFGIIFIISGILFYFGVLLNLIKAWKLMSKEEKSKIKIKPLCHNIGLIIALTGVIFLLAGLVPIFRENYFTYVMIAWIAFMGLDAYWIFKTKRYTN